MGIGDGRRAVTGALSPRRWFTNSAAWIAVGALVVLQLLFVYVPFMNLWFHTAPVTFHDWLLPIGVGAGILLSVEIEKAVIRWRKSRGLAHPAAGARMRQ